MKNVSSAFKQKIKSFGREFDCYIQYTENNQTITINKENINSVSLHYDGDILKSIMRQVDIEVKESIPTNTRITIYYGIKIYNDGRQNSYEYVNLGEYLITKVEKEEDNESYLLTGYDNLIYSMQNYNIYELTEDTTFMQDKVYYQINNNGYYVEYTGERTGNPSQLELYEIYITYPITIRNYINALSNHLGITFGNSSDTFANYDKTITSELYLDSDKKSLGYTFRDVFDELSQVVGGNIWINPSNGNLEIKYFTNTNETIDEENLKDINVKFGKKFGKVNSVVLSRSAESDNIYLRDEESVTLNGLCEIKIVDNQIMNGNDRSDYLQGILNQVDGMEFYINDFSSMGIVYLDAMDKYNIQIGNNTYNCVMLNDEINITQGLEELIHTDEPNEAKTDYTKADKTDRKINQTTLIVDKQNGIIQGVVESVSGYDGRISRVETTQTDQGETISIISKNINPITGEIESVKTVKGYTLDADGLKIASDEETFNSLSNTTGTYYKDGNVILSQFTKDNTIVKDMVLYGKYYYGVDETINVENFTKDDAMFVAEKFTNDNNEECFGHFVNSN